MDHKFSKNRKYYTISIYAVVGIIVSAIFIRLIYNWADTMYIFRQIVSMVMPFIVGMFIAYMINPLVKLISEKFLLKVCKLKKRKLRVAIAITLSYIIVIGAIAVILVFVVPQIVDSVKALGGLLDTATTGYKNVMVFLEALAEKYPQLGVESWMEQIEGIPAMLADTAKKIIPKLVPKVFSTSVSVITGLSNTLIAIMVSIYMLFDKTRIVNTGKKVIYAILDKKRGTAFLKTLSECNDIFSGFIVGKFIDSVIIGILCFIILSIFRTPCAVIISVIVGVTNMIPYFGPFIGAIPSIILLLFIDFRYAILFAIIILILQQFDGLYLVTSILGESTGLRPLWVIFAITVGGYVAGPIGMFLGVPTVAVIAHLTEAYIEAKLKKKSIEFKKNEETDIVYLEEKDETNNKGSDVDVLQKE